MKTVLLTDNIRIDWNGSATFNVYAFGVETDAFTVYGITNNSDAELAAKEWYWENVSPNLGTW
jgi:hypothetical protein